MSEQPARRGGSRPGAGRKPSGHRERTVCLPEWAWQVIEGHRVRGGHRDTSATILALLSPQFPSGPGWCPDCDSPVPGIHDADCIH